MNQLQVSLTQSHFATEDQQESTESLHYAREAAVVDRISGTVLSAAYRCGGKIIKECVILSLVGPSEQEQVTSESPALATDCIRFMGWAKLEASSEGQGIRIQNILSLSLYRV
jgi:hypothetical protein